MFLWQLLMTNPLSALALLVALGTLVWCLRTIRLQPTPTDRYLMGLVGLIAMYQGLSVLKSAGFWQYPPQMQTLRGAVDTAVASLCLVAAVILRMAATERHNTRVQLRVVEANQPAPPAKPLTAITERSVLAVFGIDGTGDINLWHRTSEDFFGWRRDEVLGTHRPFGSRVTRDELEIGTPKLVRVKTKQEGEFDVLVWMMPVPGERSSLILVLDFRKPEVAESKLLLAPPSNLVRPELSMIG